MTKRTTKSVKGTPAKRVNGRAVGSKALTESVLLERASGSIRLRDGGELTSGLRGGSKTNR